MGFGKADQISSRKICYLDACFIFKDGNTLLTLAWTVRVGHSQWSDTEVGR